MERIAIITPCILPVPATKGGAVEGLITRIIEENEKKNQFIIDLYCIKDENSKEIKYNSTHLLYVDRSPIIAFVDNKTDAIYRRIGSNSKRLLDKKVLDLFIERTNELEENYSAVIVQNLMSTAIEIVNFCRGKYEIPVFFHMHNCVDVYRSPQYIRELVKAGVQFIAVSNYIKDEILCCDKNAVVNVLYNGVNQNNRIKKDEKEKATKFLYSGRIIPDKGVKELVIAFSQYIDRLDISERKEYGLDIIGFSDKKTHYEKTVIKYAEKNKDNIHCLKMISSEKILQKYYDYDVVVMPTQNMEPFGLVALETISRGIPLITTNSGALPEILGDGAVIIDRGASFLDDLEKALGRLSLDYEYRRTIAEKGFIRSKKIADFNIDNYYENFVDVISEKCENATVSVIVPVYNVEQYLDRCVNSLINQSYTQLEIILVDDGSTDSSGMLCDAFAQKDQRIKVVHQQNQGLSAARNSGLEIMSGDLVFFCDSDDYLNTDAIKSMVTKMYRDHADIVACGIMLTGDKEELFTNENCGMWSGHEAVIQMMRTNNICTVAWNKLYKKHLFDAVRFPIGVLHEDEATTYKLIYKAKIVSFTPVPYYYYYQRNSGIMGEKISDRSHYYIDALKERVLFFEQNKEDNLIQHSLISLLDGIKYIYRNTDDKKIKKKMTQAYKESIKKWKTPDIMGVGKAMSLLLWECIRY
ncbi:glycosyltransferase [Butyrivibrio sp. INlla16]|uniref:glycosyltransferase n=1 Tax=Butyrivibrio sp. INlla16 TaxID=1520807 RepID=UPI00087FAAF9|nr:glycosyltransferase [Butyrivibrio sp. INlla16]SDB69130.1 Glycosyltransferase involved in cell wall bisynthesis [Butyrivibrio sp. INlla16]